MHRSLLLTLVAAISLAGCSGQGGNIASSQASSQTTSTQTISRHPYSIPITGTAPENVARNEKISLGGILNTVIGGLMDSPTFNPGDQVNLALTGVDLLMYGAAVPMTVYAHPTIVNLLSYQNKAFNLGSSLLPGAHYTGVRLHVAVGSSSVVTGGVSYPMVFGKIGGNGGQFVQDPGTSEAIDIPLPVDNTTGQAVFVVDFNLMESINLVGGQAQVTPVARAVSASNEAQVTGTIISSKNGWPVMNASVVAYNPDGTVAGSATTGFAGVFDVHGIPGGTYSVKVFNQYKTASGQVIKAVNAGNATASIGGPVVSIQAGMSIDVQQILD